MTGSIVKVESQEAIQVIEGTIVHTPTTEVIQVIEGAVVTCCRCDKTDGLLFEPDPYAVEFADESKTAEDLAEALAPTWWCEHHLQEQADAI